MNYAKRVTVIPLVENSVSVPALKAEHGLSLFIELDGRSLLFDTGQTNVCVRNANHLKVALNQIESVVLSHGHADHSGGIVPVLRVAPQAKVFAHPGVFRQRYIQTARDNLRPVGMKTNKRTLQSKCAELLLNSKFQNVQPSAWTTGEVPRTTSYESITEPFFLDKRCRQRDPIEDDQGLLILMENSMLVFLGCAHSGPVNTLLQA